MPIVSEFWKIRLNMVLRSFWYLVVIISFVCLNKRVYFGFLSFCFLFAWCFQYFRKKMLWLSLLAGNCFFILQFFFFYHIQTRFEVIGNRFWRRRSLNLKVYILLFLLKLLEFILFYLGLFHHQWLVTLYFW